VGNKNINNNRSNRYKNIIYLFYNKNNIRQILKSVTDSVIKSVTDSVIEFVTESVTIHQRPVK